jgi:hypothetical protein
MPAPEQDSSGLPNEMRTRLALERDESEHRKILDAANQVGELTETLHKDYAERKILTREDEKKLSTVEKLAKKILDHAGGQRVDGKTSDDPPPTLEAALEQLSGAGARVKQAVTTGTRYVVSAVVISDSNAIIKLAQFIRRKVQAK